MKLILLLFRLLIFIWALICFHSCVKSTPPDSNSQTKQSWLLELRIIESYDSFAYSDSASMVVLLNNGEITISDIKNFKPKTNRSTYTLGSCTATWLPDSVGETNVTGASGTLSGSSGNSGQDLFLTITHKDAVSPSFSKFCIGSAIETDPAIPISGLPAISYFSLVAGQKVYEQDEGDEFQRLTLIK